MLRERVERSRLQEPGVHRPDGRQRRRRGWPMRHRARGEWEREEPGRAPSHGRAFRRRSVRGGMWREKAIKTVEIKGCSYRYPTLGTKTKTCRRWGTHFH